MRLWGAGREAHQQDLKPALLELCGAVVSSSCQRQLPREALGYEVSVFSYGKAPGFSLVKIQAKGAESRQKRKKQAQPGLQGQRIEVRDGLGGKENLSSLDRFGEG